MQEESLPYTNWVNVSFLENLYQEYKKDPSKVDSSWQSFFAGMEFASQTKLSLSKEDAVCVDDNVGVFQLIDAYRRFGHKKSQELLPENYGLKDLAKEVPTYGVLEQKTATLSSLIAALKEKYCKGIGFETEQVAENVALWLRPYIEKKGVQFSKEDRLQMLEYVIKAEVFETFIHTKYPGQMRFSLEGAETLIPMLHFVCDMNAELGMDEVVLGMAHRGRLNVLANVLEKSYFSIFGEFEDLSAEDGSGDVKYHKGGHTNKTTKSGKYIEITLAPNASHLESVDPVVQGIVRAKQDQKIQAVAVLVHGDASVAGQGVVYETLQLSKVAGYTTGGTIHIVVNNHIGYTTLPEEGRSTLYCTDIAKAFGCPVFHVDAERPEECMSAVFLAVQIRHLFHVDVFIDLNCYRKYGHNEGDEPMYTQPLEYKEIKQKKTIRSLLESQLIAEGVITAQFASEKEEQFKKTLQKVLQEVVSTPKTPKEVLPYKQALTEAPTAPFSIEKLKGLVEKFSFIPDGFHIHPKLKKQIQEHLAMIEDPMQRSLDWALAELLAYATLLVEATTVRLSGQDVQRGTFSHRHSVWIDQETAQKYFPLNHLQKNQGDFYGYNSPLSEFAVMGFELGYSQTHPQALVLWEAQFGDFFNGAQVIIDQYLAGAEQKWKHRSNLTLLLPHGYEGKGPEHSSARIERFLQLCAEDNLIVANCTTPSQFFHLLRRQAYLILKRPLVVFTPKTLLRHPSCVSSVKDLAHGQFAECLAEEELDLNAQTVFLCSGKIYYDLVQERSSRKKKHIAIIRIEQLYPFPFDLLFSFLDQFSQVKQILWVQEEPQNMGAWNYIRELWSQERFEKYGPIYYAGRQKSASPATGSYLLHKKQYEYLMWQAFDAKKEDLCK